MLWSIGVSFRKINSIQPCNIATINSSSNSVNLHLLLRGIIILHDFRPKGDILRIDRINILQGSEKLRFSKFGSRSDEPSLDWFLSRLFLNIRIRDSKSVDCDLLLEL